VSSQSETARVPNEAAIVRLVGAILLEQNDEWALQRLHHGMPSACAMRWISRMISGFTLNAQLCVRPLRRNVRRSRRCKAALHVGRWGSPSAGRRIRDRLLVACTVGRVRRLLCCARQGEVSLVVAPSQPDTQTSRATGFRITQACVVVVKVNN
jgi:hypothetical protein